VKRVRGRVLLGLLAIAALFILRTFLWRPLAVSGRSPDDGFIRVPGAVHVHTTFSDGGGTPDEVIAAARAAGLRFVVITDHNSLDAKPREGYRDGVLVIVGTEISTTAGHLLGLGIPDPPFRFSGGAQDALDDVRDLGGVAVAAHPLSARPDFVWSGWELGGPWGLELLNGDSQWRSAGWGALVKTLALYRVNPGYALLGSLTSPTAALARWDGLLAKRDVAGSVGADAHSRVVLNKRFVLRFPSYASIFALAQDHVLLEKPLSGEAGADSVAILDALARGRSYVGLDALAPANAFSFVAQAGGRRWTMGETAPPDPALRLSVTGLLPAGARVTLLKDGKIIASGQGPIETRGRGAGVYRVEVGVPGWDTPWVLSNPIYVFGDQEAAERARRAAWSSPPRAPEGVLLAPIADLAPEFDASSSMSLDRGAMSFQLGTPGPGRAHVWCALTSRKERDLSGRQGLVFSIRGDQAYRLWVQVRDANPASADEATEWWFGSVKTSPEWRRVAVPFASLRSINPKSDGRLDLDKVRALVLLLDEASVKAGTTGSIQLSNIGVY
jgi:hypothetical protein